MKAESGRNRKKRRDQYDTTVPFARANTDITATPPERRRNDGTSVGYSGRVALRREQCDMMHTGLLETEATAVARQRLGKDVTAEKKKHVTIEKLLDAVILCDQCRIKY
jgi:hypothetical protein